MVRRSRRSAQAAAVKGDQVTVGKNLCLLFQKYFLAPKHPVKAKFAISKKNKKMKKISIFFFKNFFGFQKFFFFGKKIFQPRPFGFSNALEKVTLLCLLTYIKKIIIDEVNQLWNRDFENFMEGGVHFWGSPTNLEIWNFQNWPIFQIGIKKSQNNVKK